MKQKTKTIVILFLITVVVSGLVVGLIMPGILRNIRNKGDDGVYIHSDADLIGFPGNGTLENPYIIENLDLHASGYTFSSIDISSATKHIIIRNCIIQDVRCIVDCYPYAITLDNIYDGSITIYNNTIRSSWGGILMDSVSNVNITNNLIIDCNYCISTLLCFYLNVEKNSFVNCGRMSTDIYYSEINDNYFYESELEVTSYNCNYSRNIFENCSISISYFHEIEISNNSFEENIINGKSFGYFSNCANINLNGSIYAQLVFIKCSNVLIANQIFSSTSTSIYLFQCNEVTINNTIFLDSALGIKARESDNVNITYCKFIECNYAINTRYGNNFYISYNNITLSQQTGIYLVTSNSIIHHNSFFSNQNHAADYSVNSVWYDSYLLAGNFWDTWNGIGSYNIPGSAGASDLYPLSEPPV